MEEEKTTTSLHFLSLHTQKQQSVRRKDSVRSLSMSMKFKVQTFSLCKPDHLNGIWQLTRAGSTMSSPFKTSD